jgi:hypothetical protein
MDFFLLILIIVAIVAVAAMWWYSRRLHYIPDDTVIYLNSDEDKVLHPWYQSVVYDHAYDLDLHSNEVAAQFLSIVHGREVNPELLVMGEDLNLQYHRLTHQLLPHDSVISVRDALGIPGEIAIVEDESVRARLRAHNEYDANYLAHVLRSDGVAVIARDYLRQVLDFRWNKLRELNLSVIENDGGSYAYVRDWTVPNVAVAVSKLGQRANLLCSDVEFSNLLKRLAKAGSEYDSVLYTS